jgi:hypothetical protein
VIATFVRIWAPSDLRLGMAISTVARWQLDPLADLVLVICEESLVYPGWQGLKKIVLPASNFAQKSIAAMEEMSYGDFYSGGDDDMLIYGKNFLDRMLAVMGRNQEYGILCASPTNEGIQTGRGDSEVIESHAVGGPGLVRKGVMKDFPPISNQQYAGWCDSQFRSQGWKMGYMRDVRYCHLGSRFSFSSPAHCDGY